MAGRARINPSEDITLAESFGCRSSPAKVTTGLVGAGLPALQGRKHRTDVISTSAPLYSGLLTCHKNNRLII